MANKPITSNVQDVEIDPSAIPAFFTVAPMLSSNPSVGGVLQILGLKHRGILLVWTDAYGSLVWQTELRATPQRKWNGYVRKTKPAKRTR